MMAQDRQAWVLETIEAARPTAAKIGISPEAIVAQAALESGWGKHAIGKNLFGIKSSAGWHGKTQTVRTREVDQNGREYWIDAAFRDYDTYEESVADHFAFLDRNSRYRKAGVFDGKGDEAYFEALQRAGYATDPNYATMLMQVLRMVHEIAGTPAAARTILRLGHSGGEVLALQRELNKQFQADLDEDGHYGSLTMLAVRHWQRHKGLVVDGVAGPKTRASLGL